jgi:hypothetical protein
MPAFSCVEQKNPVVPDKCVLGKVPVTGEKRGSRKCRVNAEIGASGCHPCREEEKRNRIIGLISPFLPPRVFLKCPSIRAMDGRGGGDRTKSAIEIV